VTRGGKVGLSIGCLLILFVFAVLSVGFGADWILQFFFHLGFGWIGHLSAVLPKVTIGWSGVGFFAVSVVLAAFIGHRFCGWLWQGSGRGDPWQLRWTLSGFAILILMFGAGMTITAVAHQTGWLLHSPEPMVKSSSSNDRNATASLKTIATAQADFRANDRDGNQVNDFWRADIAGLYALKAGGTAIKLIELSVAAADDRPVTDITSFAQRSPKAGYWYRALRYKDETEKLDPNRYAACSFPASDHAGKYLFLVTQENTIYRKIFEGTPPDFCPDDPLKEGWEKLD
jgi:hypothetical protein